MSTNNNSSKIPVKLAQRLPTIEEGGIYEITKAEMVTTIVRGFKGVRVTLKDEKGNEYAEMLWIREVVGPRSKLGAFIEALGDELTKWVGKKIFISRWRSGDRYIEVLK